MESVSVCGGVRYGEWNSLVSLNSLFFLFVWWWAGDGLCARS